MGIFNRKKHYNLQQSNYINELKDFYSDKWIGLNADERLEKLQVLENNIALQQGRMAREVKPVSTSLAGYYTGNAPTNIYINDKYLTDNSQGQNFDAMDTVLHEGRHAYQDDVIMGRLVENKFPEDQQRAEIWKKNSMKGIYLHGEPDYRFQPIEEDAYNFAEEKMRDYQILFGDDEGYWKYRQNVDDNRLSQERRAEEIYGKDYKEKITEAVRNQKVGENDFYNYEKISTNIVTKVDDKVQNIGIKSGDDAKNFMDENCRIVKTTEPITLYRVYDGKNAHLKGLYWTTEEPTDRMYTKMYSGVPAIYRNQKEDGTIEYGPGSLRTKYAVMEVPAGTVFDIGKVGKVDLENGEKLPGGMDQIVLPKNFWEKEKHSAYIKEKDIDLGYNSGYKDFNQHVQTKYESKIDGEAEEKSNSKEAFESRKDEEKIERSKLTEAAENKKVGEEQEELKSREKEESKKDKEAEEKQEKKELGEEKRAEKEQISLKSEETEKNKKDKEAEEKQRDKEETKKNEEEEQRGLKSEEKEENKKDKEAEEEQKNLKSEEAEKSKKEKETEETKRKKEEEAKKKAEEEQKSLKSEEAEKSKKEKETEKTKRKREEEAKKKTEEERKNLKSKETEKSKKEKEAQETKKKKGEEAKKKAEEEQKSLKSKETEKKKKEKEAEEKQRKKEEEEKKKENGKIKGKYYGIGY